MEEEIIKKIALAAARKRHSLQTGFLHHYRDDPYAPSQDTIPVLENFLYAYSLFRSKTVENIQEAKALLEKLLAFEVEGNFPVYLHEYPLCKDQKISSHLLPILFYLLRDFSQVLGECLNTKLKALSEKIVSFLQKQNLSFVAQAKLDAFTGNFDPLKWGPKTPEEWGEYCLCLQMSGKDFPFDQPLWNASLGVFVGETKDRIQEGHEPALTFFDLFMEKYAKKALLDHPVHLKASLVRPWKKRAPLFQEQSEVILVQEEQRQPLIFYFGSLNQTHSLVLEAKKGVWKIEEKENEWVCKYEYAEEFPHEEDAMEWAFYLNDAPEHNILVEGQKATLFEKGDTVSISSNNLEISFHVDVDAKDGSFMGHISKGDRSFQKSKSLPYGGYDWKIGWRTIKRPSQAAVVLSIKLRKE